MAYRDPRMLYTVTRQPPPSRTAYQRHYARRGLIIATILEGASVLFLIVIFRSLVVVGLLDGVDELLAVLTITVGTALSSVGWTIGSIVGWLRYREALAAWQRARDVSRQVGD